MYNVFTLEWDDRKAHANFLKHGVSFEEAMSIFQDESSLCVHDPDHSVTEDRFLMFGISEKNRSIVVSHVYRKSEDAVRIISARETTTNERSEILKYWG